MKHFILLLTLLPSALCGMFRNPCDETFGGHMLGSAAADETAECPALPRLAGIPTWWTDFQQKHRLILTDAYHTVNHEPEPKTLAEIIKRAHRGWGLSNSKPFTISEKHVLAIDLQNIVHNFNYYPPSIRDALKNITRVTLKLLEQSDSSSSHRIFKTLKNMLLVQRFFEQRGYTTFYHGASQSYALFLELNRRLHAYTTGRQSPELWQYLRVPGDRCRNILRWFNAGIYQRIIEIYDTDDSETKIRSRLLSVGYTPLACFHASFSPKFTIIFRDNVAAEGPFYFYIRNTSGSSHWPHFFNMLCRHYGCIDKISPKLRDGQYNGDAKFGICVQIFIHRSLVNQLVYPSKPWGSPKYPVVFKNVCCDLTHELMKLDQLSARSGPEKFEGQARILLNPNYFDNPNQKIKIIVWDFRTPEEQKTFDSECDEIMAIAKQQIDAQRQIGEELSAEHIAGTLSRFWPDK